MESIWVGMSGGVDSSVAALLLKEQGVRVTGVTLRLKCGLDAEQATNTDIEDARRVCEKLEIEHKVLEASDAFRRCVVDEFVAEYLAGRTPNPCVTCNRTIKFGVLLDAALDSGAQGVATGHYARVAFHPQSGRWRLFRADSGKDQSYVLYGLTQQQLAHVRFPLYGMEKAQVRQLAQRYELPVANKSDSMEVCFIPDNDHAGFIERYMGEIMQTGEFVDEHGHILGRHKGIGRYTVGQRKGIGIAFGKPMYVVGLDAENNRVVLGEEGRQMASSLIAEDARFLSIERPSSPISVQAKIRYQASASPALLTPMDDGRIRVEFDSPQRAVTPGQSVVFYDGDMVLGGAIIQNRV